MENNDQIKCDLRQACEWIAFGWDPTNLVDYARADNYDQKILKAQNGLEEALYEKKIIATGFRHFRALEEMRNEMQDIAILIGTPNIPAPKKALLDEHLNVVTTLENQLVKITNFMHDSKIDIENNFIITKNYDVPFYTKIKIVFSDLKREFPREQPKSPRDKMPSYIPPYIEIMLEVIEEMEISPTNQYYKKQLIPIFEEKLRQIKYPSNYMAEAMASFVRLSESGKGKALKKG